MKSFARSIGSNIAKIPGINGPKIIALPSTNHSNGVVGGVVATVVVGGLVKGGYALYRFMTGAEDNGMRLEDLPADVQMSLFEQAKEELAKAASAKA